MDLKQKARHAVHTLSECSAKASQKTNRTRAGIIADMLYCAARYGASPKNYYWFGFYELTAEQRSTFVTHMMSEKIQKKRNNPTKTTIFQNKRQFYDAFSEYMMRKVCSSEELTSPGSLHEIGEKIIYKPISGGQGFGVRVFHVTEESKAEVFTAIKQLPVGVVETFLQQHEEMDSFSDAAVNIVRVVTGRVGERFSVLAATAAFSKGLEYTNASGDAVFANVDIQTGVIISDGCDYTEAVYIEHPVSKIPFKGFRIPFWERLIDMLESASKVVAEVGYVGWDVAITTTGPVIIEGNNDPGYEWMQLRMINPAGIGKKKEYEFLL